MPIVGAERISLSLGAPDDVGDVLDFDEIRAISGAVGVTGLGSWNGADGAWYAP